MLSTNRLLNRIIKSKDLTEMLEQNKDEFEEQSIAEYLNNLCYMRGEVPEHIIKKAQIDRTYGHQIFNGTRIPSRDKLIQLALGFGLSLDETQKLLKLSGKSILYAKIKRDAVCIFAISNHKGMLELQEILEFAGLPMLGQV